MTEQVWCLKGELSLEDAQNLEVIVEDIAGSLDIFPPTLSYFEQDDSALWCVEIFFPEAPDYAFITGLLETANLLDWEHTVFPVEDKDWVSESQKLLSPVEAGVFFVYGSHDADKVQAGKINLQIDAGQAFGTGKHETTAACLETLSNKRESLKPQHILDLGTGSGVLALGAHNLWPEAHICASDIDPIAVQVAVENVTLNGGKIRAAGAADPGISLVVADGIHDEGIKTDAPYDLIIANILAGPLIDMAEDVTSCLKDNGLLVLSGLLVSQEKEVLDAYEARGLKSQDKIEKGDWLAIALTRGK